MWVRTTARTFITAIANVIDVSVAVASTKAWVLGSRFTKSRRVEDSRRGHIMALDAAGGYPSIEPSRAFSRVGAVCGICGIASARGAADPDRVVAMSATLVHRG